MQDASNTTSSGKNRWQLTITHLLLWTLGTATALKVDGRRFWAVEGLSSYWLAPAATDRLGIIFAWGLEVTTASLYGIGVAVLVHFWVRHWKDRQIPKLEPGHWILICSGSSTILSLLLVLAGAPLRNLVEVAWGLSAVTWFVSAEAIIEPKVWRFCFLMLGLRDACIAVAGLIAKPLSMEPSWWSGALVAFLIFALLALTGFVAALLKDLEVRQRRGPLHWLGVTTSLIVPVHIVCHFAGMRILPSIAIVPL